MPPAAAPTDAPTARGEVRIAKCSRCKGPHTVVCDLKLGKRGASAVYTCPGDGKGASIRVSRAVFESVKAGKTPAKKPATRRRAPRRAKEPEMNGAKVKGAGKLTLSIPLETPIEMSDEVVNDIARGLVAEWMRRQGATGARGAMAAKLQKGQDEADSTERQIGAAIVESMIAVLVVEYGVTPQTWAAWMPAEVTSVLPGVRQGGSGVFGGRADGAVRAIGGAVGGLAAGALGVSPALGAAAGAELGDFFFPDFLDDDGPPVVGGGGGFGGGSSGGGGAGNSFGQGALPLRTVME